MSSTKLSPRDLLPMACAYMCLHALAIVLAHSHAMAASFPFLMLTPILALAAIVYCTQRSIRRRQYLWPLLCVSLVLWTIGMALSAWEELYMHAAYTIALFSDFVFFIYGLPILLAISTPEETPRSPLFFWLNATQAAATALLTYMVIFSVMPFTRRPAEPIEINLLVLTYNIENTLLALAATIRLLASPKSKHDRRFHQILCAFLWTYALCVGFYNRMSIVTQDGTGLYDLLVDLPFLLLTVLTLAPLPVIEDSSSSLATRPFSLFIDNASPIFFTLSMLGLGALIARHHFSTGIAAIVLALFLYGLRSVLTQNLYLQSQTALQSARDQLERLSLTDELTGVANRRHFDRSMHMEWTRLGRHRRPLALLLIDIDYFKMLNDTYGHSQGDLCLRQVAHALESTLRREADLLARYGGEEFVVLLPETNMQGAEIVALRMQGVIRQLRLRNRTPLGTWVTISVGLAVARTSKSTSPAELVEAADRALYRAKQNGRNRVEHTSLEAIVS